MDGSSLHVLVLAGGPDREREVSFKSGAEVTAALRAAGHTVKQRDIHAQDLGALDRFVDWPGDVIFPVLHGPWGEGGGLQQLLDARGLPYVGTRAEAAALCMDKSATKRALRRNNLPTPEFAVVRDGEALELQPPVVVKATSEGSSIGMAICHDAAQLDKARTELGAQYDALMVERFITGREVTVGVLDKPDGTSEALPPIEIVPAVDYYDFAAKYDRDDTQYRFDIDLPPHILDRLRDVALSAHRALGAAHLSRVDFMVDADGEPWVLEINTLPGFTTHSLLPMAAAEAGLAMPALVDRLARLAVG